MRAQHYIAVQTSATDLATSNASSSEFSLILPGFCTNCSVFSVFLKKLLKVDIRSDDLAVNDF